MLDGEDVVHLVVAVPAEVDRAAAKLLKYLCIVRPVRPGIILRIDVDDGIVPNQNLSGDHVRVLRDGSRPEPVHGQRLEIPRHRNHRLDHEAQELLDKVRPIVEKKIDAASHELMGRVERALKVRKGYLNRAVAVRVVPEFVSIELHELRGPARKPASEIHVAASEKLLDPSEILGMLDPRVHVVPDGPLPAKHACNDHRSVIRPDRQRAVVAHMLAALLPPAEARAVLGELGPEDADAAWALVREAAECGDRALLSERLARVAQLVGERRDALALWREAAESADGAGVSDVDRVALWERVVPLSPSAKRPWEALLRLHRDQPTDLAVTLVRVARTHDDDRARSVALWAAGRIEESAARPQLAGELYLEARDASEVDPVPAAILHDRALAGDVDATSSERAELLVELAGRLRSGVDAARRLLEAGRVFVDEVGDTDRALECFVAAVRRDPTAEEAADRAASMLDERRGFTELAALLERRIRRLEEPEALLPLLRRLADVQMGPLGDRAAAGETLERVVELAPEDPATRRLLADLRYAQERWPEAAQQYEWLVASGAEPDLVHLYTRLGQIRAHHLGDLNGAIEHLRRAVGLLDPDGRALEELAGVYLMAGEADMALLAYQRLERVADAGDRVAAARAGQVRSLLARGRRAEAIEQLTAFRRADPVDPMLAALARDLDADAAPRGPAEELLPRRDAPQGAVLAAVQLSQVLSPVPSGPDGGEPVPVVDAHVAPPLESTEALIPLDDEFLDNPDAFGQPGAGDLGAPALEAPSVPPLPDPPPLEAEPLRSPPPMATLEPLSGGPPLELDLGDLEDFDDEPLGVAGGPTAEQPTVAAAEDIAATAEQAPIAVPPPPPSDPFELDLSVLDGDELVSAIDDALGDIDPTGDTGALEPVAERPRSTMPYGQQFAPAPRAPAEAPVAAPEDESEARDGAGGTETGMPILVMGATTEQPAIALDGGAQGGLGDLPPGAEVSIEESLTDLVIDATALARDARGRIDRDPLDGEAWRDLQRAVAVGGSTASAAWLQGVTAWVEGEVRPATPCVPSGPVSDRLRRPLLPETVPANLLMLLRAVGPTIAPAFGRRGQASTEERVAHHEGLHQMARRLGVALDVTDFDVVRNAGRPYTVTVDTGERTTVVLGTAIVSGADDAGRSFLLGRCLVPLREGTLAARKLSDREFRAFLGALLGLLGGSYPVRARDRATYERIQGDLERLVGDAPDPEWTALASAAASGLATFPPAAVRAGLELYAARLALALADGFGGAFEMLRLQDFDDRPRSALDRPDIEQFLADSEVARDLLLFAGSAQCLAVRAWLAGETT